MWQRRHRTFPFIPGFSCPLPKEGCYGRTGLGPRAVLNDFSDWSNFQVYACGAPAMTDVARATFVEQRGLAEDEFFCDAFTPSVDPRM